MTKAEEAVNPANNSPANHSPMNRTQFHKAFPQLSSALLEEWPQIEAESLSATQGELDKVVGLIVEKTGHTKTLARRQLEELYRIVTAPTDGGSFGASARGAATVFAHDARAAAATVSEAAHEALTSVEEVLARFEKKTARMLRDLHLNQVVTHTGDKIREHWLASLLVTLGLGFIVAAVVTGLTRGK